VSPAPGVFVL